MCVCVCVCLCVCVCVCVRACVCACVCVYRLLRMTMNGSEIRTQDISQTIEAVAANRWGRDLAFHFVVEHFSTLVDM